MSVALLDRTSAPLRIETLISRFCQEVPVRIADLALELGINVYVKDLAGGVSGVLERDPQRGGRTGYSITVNSHDPQERQRFTIAHQIGHLILHTDRVGDLLVDDHYFRSRLQEPLESEATRFAYTLLMPMSHIYRFLDDGVTDPEKMAELFQVTATAMCQRLDLPTL